MELITVEVATSNGVFSEAFPKTAKVQDVIDAAVKAKKLKSGDVFELYYGDVPLKPTTRPLVSFGLSGTVKMELVATGSGV